MRVPLFQDDLILSYHISDLLVEQSVSLHGHVIVSPHHFRHITNPPNSRYDTRVITKLTKNYRSHPIILELPNRVFYDGDLEACAEQMISHNMCRWECLPTQNVPMIFHGVEGKPSSDAASHDLKPEPDPDHTSRP